MGSCLSTWGLILSTVGSVLLGFNVIFPRMGLRWYTQASEYMKAKEDAEKYVDLIDPDRVRPGRESYIDTLARFYFRDFLAGKAQKVGYLAFVILFAGLVLQVCGC